MKFKKLIIACAAFTALIAGGCSKQQSKKAEPVLTKSQVIKKSQKTFKSGQVIQSLRLSTDTSSQLVVANTIFGGEPTVFHITNQTTSAGKTRTSENWATASNLYINGSKTWYKTDLEKLTGHSYAELLSVIMNNKVIFNPDQALLNAYKMKRNKQTYTLTAKLKDPKMMSTAAEQIISTVGQSSEQEQVFRRVQKYGKFKDMTVKLVVKKKKLAAANIFVNMTLGKYMKVRLGQSYGNFGSRDFLKVPTNALNAENLPMTEKKKTTKENKKVSKKTKKIIKKSKKTTKDKK
ncbi:MULTISPECIES: hypothetical protein [Lactobacillus]|uniref:hypothetical protein n=1 Tax=Lactobacillus TaxID=1578 RepID=UPI001F2B2C6C|nr:MULTISPECIES: hypothetical protein [Lactobacillus]